MILYFTNWKAVTVIRLFPFRVSLSSKGDDSEKCTMDKYIYKEKMCKLLGVTDHVSSITFYISPYLRMYSKAVRPSFSATSVKPLV